jgi:Domain of unknown function (DUF4301)
MEENFSKKDIDQIISNGIPLQKIEQQLEFFKTGISKIILEKPAVINDGIKKLSEDKAIAYAEIFDQKKQNLKLEKFVPASGAASRMFKFLNEFLNEFDIENETINAYINRKKDTNLSVFLAGMEKFPFFEAIQLQLKTDFPDFISWEKDKKNLQFIKVLLDKNHLDYANKPKGILPFHNYLDHIATPIEEHLKEAAFYANSNGKSHLHFTISEEHQAAFESILEIIKPKIETESNTKIEINFSYQNINTDTIAVDLYNKPFRDETGNLVFRPGGHGALIDNLNNLDADIVFVKNIDNVIQNHIELVAKYKKALAGILISIQEKVFDYLHQIEKNEVQTEDQIQEIIDFATKKLNVVIIGGFDKYTFENKLNYISKILNRPIRICGMVKNEGEPGGGPFWIRGLKGKISLQIIETSQIDLNDFHQKSILESATHFNPVDLVCGLKDYKGQKFDLNHFVNENRGFIVAKTKNGKELKGYELPGLWNGAMAKWITIFVEVPLITFNPVKTVNDLLKPAHQFQ